MTDRAKVAAALHLHLCEHDWHGYTQGQGRWGDGEGVCKAVVNGVTYEVEQGDRDCSSSVIECWKAAIKGTPYEGKLDGATYTGNMRQVFTQSGLFEWRPMTCVAQQGDVYLNEASHTAMCQSGVPDVLSEFLIDENGNIIGGTVGDQTGRESIVRAYYDYPWDGILCYNGLADDEPAGWHRENGKWRYCGPDGSCPKDEWEKVNGKWYLFDKDGWMLVGWQKRDGRWYHLASDGSMDEGWLKDNGYWYYLEPGQGHMRTGWTTVGGKRYYLHPEKDGIHPEGSMVVGPADIDGKHCEFGADGALVRR
ncbi:hypothetical protein GMI70_00795 [Eggerthellaceae bacterium zg-893]|nr:hypothetical protein [Eggerthellaceae bacterium zg-893]